MPVSPSAVFEQVGAPLKNVRWSWGAIREGDGTVFLRAWQDRTRVVEKQLQVLVTHFEKYEDRQDNPGHLERLQHVEAIQNGAKCFAVMCLAKDPDADPREIKSVNDRELFLGGSLVRDGVDYWLNLVDRVPLRELRM